MNSAVLSYKWCSKSLFFILFLSSGQTPYFLCLHSKKLTSKLIPSEREAITFLIYTQPSLFITISIYLTVIMKSYNQSRRNSHNTELIRHVPPFYDVPQPYNDIEIKRKPKLMKNHRVVQQLFTIQSKEFENFSFAKNSPSPLRQTPTFNNEDMYKYLLLKQRQKYAKLLQKHGITESPNLSQVDSFLSEVQSPKISQRS